MRRSIHIEIQRSNISPKAFHSLVKRKCEARGLIFMLGEYEDFEDITNEPTGYNAYYKADDGSCSCEICEFTFDSEKSGHGYYYQSWVDPR